MILLCLLVLTLPSLVLGEQFIIVQDIANCPDHGEACSTLSEQIVSSPAFTSNSVVRFLAGTHTVFENVQNDSLVVRDMYNLTLLGDGKSPSEILCYQYMKFVFINITKLTISNLSFLNCSAPFTNQLMNEMFFFVPQIMNDQSNQQKVAVFLHRVEDLQLSSVSIRNSTGFGLIGINVIGHSLVTHCDFSYNNFVHYVNGKEAGCFSPSPRKNTLECAGGGFFVAYVDTPYCDPSNESHVLSVTSSYFGYNLNLLYKGFGSGLTAMLTQNYYTVHVHIDGVIFENNLAAFGANIALQQYSSSQNSSFTVNNSISKGSNSLFDASAFFVLDTYDYLGGGLYFLYGNSLPYAPYSPVVCQELPVYRHSEDIVLFVSNTDFVSNQATVGAGTYVEVNPALKSDLASLIILFDNCSFSNNAGSPGSALDIYQSPSFKASLSTSYKIKNCVFEKNSFPRVFGDLTLDVEFDIFNTVYISSASNVTFEDCLFMENNGTALFLHNTQVQFVGNLAFESNRGSFGGGLAIHGNSVMILLPNTSITFIDNIALRGGAIFVSNANYRSRQLCFWQINERNEGNISSLNVQLIFLGNRAKRAGSVLFGGTVDDCLLTFIADYPDYNSSIIFEDLFQFEKSSNMSNISLISSVPSRVCFCYDYKPSCKKTTSYREIFPGETIEIYLITVGQRDGPTPGIINAHLKSENSQNLDNFEAQSSVFELEENVARLGAGQNTQMSRSVCTELKYTIFSTRKGLTLEFTTENPILEELTTSLVVKLKECPSGFNLTADGTACDCVSFLNEKSLECDIENQAIERVPPVWIGGQYYDNDNITISFYRYCPFDYCSPDKVNITLELLDQDRQCAHNRSGVLCGECSGNLSVIFGGNECRECSNFFLFLIVVYALAGVLLVFSLYFFNTLTVSAGTINGLIFYANIIQINKAVFFPPGHENPATIFISWLSLDLGIRTCFYDGMDVYVKTWLQFVFPMYIVVLLTIITIVSRYSTYASKMISIRAVGVLATLILLFISRIQRITINCLAFATLQHPGGSTTRVWRFDGNLPLITGKHIALFSVGIFLLVFVLAPFNFVLLFGKQFQALSSYRYFRWVNKLKPLFDAFMGPYKDRYRSWTGLFLLFRLVLIVVSVLNAQPEGTLLATAIIPQLPIIAWFNGGIYRHWPLNILELSFLLNLSITSTATLYIRSLENQSKYQSPVIYTSVFIAFMEFVIIFLHAVHDRIIKASCKSASFVKFQQCVIALGHLPQKFKHSPAVPRKKKKSSDETALKLKLSPTTNAGPTCAVVTVEVQDHDFAEHSFVALRESLLEHS